MKALYFIGLLLLSSLWIFSCRVPAQSRLQATNPQVRVELLFEVDGCKVYRFYDSGQPRYFTKCQGNVGSSSVGWVQPCGKNCSFYAENITAYTR